MCIRDSSTGMENSLYQGERVLVNKWSYVFRVAFSIWRWLGKTAGKGDIAVSYTHLDVYKRQAVFSIICTMFAIKLHN